MLLLSRSYYLRQVLEAVRTAHAQRPSAVLLRSLRPHCLVLASHANSAPLKLASLAGSQLASLAAPQAHTANGLLRQRTGGYGDPRKLTRHKRF